MANIDSLLEEMATTFNYKAKVNTNIKYDDSLKWKGLLNNKFASKTEKKIDSKSPEVDACPPKKVAINGRKNKSSKFIEKRKLKFLKGIGLLKVKVKKNTEKKQAFNIYEKKNNNKIPDVLCTCELQSPKYFIKKTSNSVYCSAIDSIDNKKIGCSNLVKSEGDFIRLSRPSAKTGYMVLCEQHKQRLHVHNCCAGCGIFCTQGKFLSCRVRHISHIRCAQKIKKNDQDSDSFKCVHCGNLTKESIIEMAYVLMKETSIL